MKNKERKQPNFMLGRIIQVIIMFALVAAIVVLCAYLVGRIDENPNIVDIGSLVAVLVVGFPVFILNLIVIVGRFNRGKYKEREDVPLNYLWIPRFFLVIILLFLCIGIIAFFGIGINFAFDYEDLPIIGLAGSILVLAVPLLLFMFSTLKCESPKEKDERIALKQKAKELRDRQRALRKSEKEKALLKRKKELEKKKAESGADEKNKEKELAAAEKKAEQARIAEEKAKALAEKKAEKDAKDAERKAQQERLDAERKAIQDRFKEERKAQQERLAAEKKAQKERLAAEKKAQQERLASEKKALQERLGLEIKAQKDKEKEELAKLADQKREEKERAKAAARLAKEDAKMDAEEKKKEEKRLVEEEKRMKKEQKQKALDAKKESKVVVTPTKQEKPVKAKKRLWIYLLGLALALLVLVIVLRVGANSVAQYSAAASANYILISRILLVLLVGICLLALLSLVLGDKEKDLVSTDRNKDLWIYLAACTLSLVVLVVTLVSVIAKADSEGVELTNNYKDVLLYVYICLAIFVILTAFAVCIRFKKPVAVVEEVKEVEVQDEEDEEDEEVEDEEDEEEYDENGIAIGSRYNLSFMARFIRAQNPCQEYYDEIKNFILSYKNVRDHISWKHEVFNKGRNKIALFKIKGKSLYVYLPLNPDDYVDSKYKFIDVREVKLYEDVPFLMKITSPRKAKHVIELLTGILEGLGLKKLEDAKFVSYHKAYKTIEQMLKMNPPLVKENPNFGAPSFDFAKKAETEEVVPVVEPAPVVEKEPVVEPTPAPVEEKVEEKIIVRRKNKVEEPAPVVEESSEEEPGYELNYLTFKQNYDLLKDDRKQYVDRIEAYCDSIKVKHSISKWHERVYVGREVVGLIKIQRKCVRFYFALPIDKVDPKINCEDVSSLKAYEETPTLIKVKNEKAFKGVCKVIAQIAESKK